LVLLLLDLLLRYKVGKAAVTEGRGGKAGRFYPFIAIVMDAFSVYSFLGTAITNFHTGELGFMEDVAALLVDFSSLVAMTELVISVFAGRRIAARIAAGKAAKEGR
ncbi:MAG: hypothetical protein UHN88_04710, partial [Eubacterium sp.]|nr:hypothetical protein [Eubacterium sp.]